MLAISKTVADLVNEGYKLRPFVIPVSAEEALAAELSAVHVEQARIGKLNSVLLEGPEGQRLRYTFFDAVTVEFVNSHIERANANATSNIFVMFSIFFFQVGETPHHDLDNLISSMWRAFGWDVRRSSVGGTFFEMLLTRQPAHEGARRSILEEIEKKFLALSLLYRAGMYIHYFNMTTVPEGEIGYGVGPMQKPTVSFSQEHIDIMHRAFGTDRAMRAARGLQAFYRQSTKVGRVAIGWMLLEDLFGSTKGHKHVLSSEEQDRIARLIADMLGTDDARLPKVLSAFKDGNLFRKSRNEIMAERIARVRQEDYATVLAVIRDLSVTRGKILHSFSPEDEIDVSTCELFIEETVSKFIAQESGVSMLRLRSE